MKRFSNTLHRALAVFCAASLTATAGEDAPEADHSVADAKDPAKERPAALEMNIWEAALRANTKAIKQHLAAGTDLDGKASEQEVTPLHIAAFFAHEEIVKMLLEAGAGVNEINRNQQTPVETVELEWSSELEGLYKALGEELKVEIDVERIKTGRPKVARLLRDAGGTTNAEYLAGASENLFEAAVKGDTRAIRKLVAEGHDVDGIEAQGGSTPLHLAALFGKAGAIKVLIESGAEPSATNNDGTTALHMAAFLAHPNAVKALLAKEAPLEAKNKRGETALDTVKAEWSEQLEGVYKYVGGILETELDLERIKMTRPQVTAILRGKRPTKPTGKSDGTTPTKFRGSYFKNGEIHVNTYGTPEGKPLTSGHQDFKPSWSKTGDMLVFFRRLKNDPVVTNWITQICVIDVDGSGFHPLTDGTHTDFNQTWTRDGTNTPIWNRKHPDRVSFQVMSSKVGAKPGEEIALTDKSYHAWAYTCLKDGRILVSAAHPKHGRGYFLMTPNSGKEPLLERIDCGLAEKGILDRVSVSPSETKVCFEFQDGFEYKDTGRTLYVADFDAQKRTISNPKPFANKEGKNRWFAYPRWTKDESAIVYHASPSLYLYTLEGGSTIKVSSDPKADYRYPHCEATPK